MPSKPLTDFIGDGPEQAVTQCCEGCVALQMELREAERRYQQLAAGVCLDLQGAHAVPAGYHTHGDAILARHERERKEAPDAQAAP